MKTPLDRLVDWPAERPSAAMLAEYGGHLFATDGQGRPLLYLGAWPELHVNSWPKVKNER